MIEVAGKPIIQYIIEYWSQFTHNFIFVVNYRKDDVINYVKSIPINAHFAESPDLKGIAYGISIVEKLVGERFIVVLGDCMCRGIFNFPSHFEQGVGVLRTSDTNNIKRNFSVEIKNNYISRVVEKPIIIPNDLCGTGFYFFSKKVFDYIKTAKPSKLRGEIEITDVIQNMIEANEKISPVFLNGDYINITYQEDLNRAERILKI